ncbi:MAG: roadblock/LC7 domain-containing protein [Deltaproteobacteria bacterium]|nr:roadblock/LC7 domain-containing protein [Deltaproteobacteria bacterium]
MPFKNILRELATRSGAEGAIMLAPDGEPVGSFNASTECDLEAIGAHKGIIFNMLKGAASRTGTNGDRDIHSVSITTENAKLAMVALKDGYYIVIALKKEGSFGRVFFEAKKAVREIEREMG